MTGWVAALLMGVGLAGLIGLLTPPLSWRWRAAAGVVMVLAVAGLGWGRHAAGQQPTEVQQLLNGLFLGSIYALIALGYTMVYGVLKLINFAHGEIFMVGAFVAYFCLSIYQYSPPAVAIFITMMLAMGICALLGLSIERLAYKPLRRASRLAALITAIGVSLFLQNLGILLFGAQPKTIPSVLPGTPLPWLSESTGLLVSLPNVVTVLAAVVLMIGLQLFVSRSRPGRAMRAVSEDREAAELMGINVDAIIALTFVIGSALAGAGGVLWGLRYPSIKPDLGLIPGLKAFVAAVLGGIGSIPGAMVGGLLIGVIEVLVASVTLTPMRLTHGVIALFMMFCFWRLSEDWQERMMRRRRGLTLTIGAGIAAAVSSWLACWPVAQMLAPKLSSRPEVACISGSTFRDAVVFVILIVILIVKPTGIMGRYAPEKV